MPKLPTNHSTPKLSDVARHVVVPKGVVSTGWPAVREKCRELGISFRWWQHPVGKIILAKRSDGKYAATIGGTGLSIPRQVGKTYLVGAIMFALCLLRPNLTVIWTAHRLRTAEETFGKMQKFAKRKKIAPHILKVVLGSGDEAIEFRNGSRILFGARERGFGRGFDEVDVVVYDEGQILSENALDDMIPAMNQSRQECGALLLFMGTPPKPTDPGEVFTRMRDEALSGEDEDTAWVEFGADPGHRFAALPAQLTAADWKQIEKANPSYPDDTPREAILRMRKKLGAESFLREGAGIWDDIAAGPQVMPNWMNCGIEGATPPTPAAIGIAVSIDRAWASIGVSSAGEVPHLGAHKRARGTDWVVAEAKRIHDEYGIPVVIHGRGPGADLIKPMQDAGLEPIVAGIDDYQDACANLFDAVEAGTVEHGHYDDLNEAVTVAGWTTGERRVWTRKSGDVSMLEAVTLAKWGATQSVDADPVAYYV